MTHFLKTWPEYFGPVRDGFKTFEVRKNDRDFNVGNTVVLLEFDPVVNDYTRSQPVIKYVSYVLKGGQHDIGPDTCVLGFVSDWRDLPKEGGAA